MKAVVFRISGNKTAVYTKEGDFLEIPTPKNTPGVGQMIEINVKPTQWHIKHSILKYSIAAAVFILILTLGLLNPLMWPGTAVANVALDVNYGMELYVNKQARVVDVKDVNGQLNGVLKDLDLKNMDVYEAINLILTEAKTKGVLKEEKNLVLASVIPIQDVGQNLIDNNRLTSVIREAMVSNNISGIVMAGKADEEIEARAENFGLTVNQYQIYERCLQDGKKIHADDFRSENIQQTLKNSNVSLTELFPEDCTEFPQQNSATLQGEIEKTSVNPQEQHHQDVYSPSVDGIDAPQKAEHMEDNHIYSDTHHVQSKPVEEQEHTSDWGSHERMTDGGPTKS